MKKEKSKKGLKVLCCILAVAVVLAALVAGLNYSAFNGLLEKGSAYGKTETENRLVPEKDENGYWCFTTDEEFKVLHITDIHIGGGFLSKDVDEKALNAVALMVTKEKPDLVVVTGDIAFPVPYSAGTFNNYSGAYAFANLMESLGVYWTVTFGNHDAEAYSYFDREAVAEIYSDGDFKYCLFSVGPEDVDGYGNHIVEVKNSEGIITQAMVMIDSLDYVNGNIIDSILGKYDNIHPNQVQWYENEIKRMNAENEAIEEGSSPVSSFAFFHIPLTETADAWSEFCENGYNDTDDFKYVEGIIAESGRQIYCGLGEDDMFEKMLELGSTKAIFNGHDHVNSTTFEYKGIIFSYGYSIDYFAYSGIDKLGSQRGCTIITCTPDGEFTVDKYNYYSDRYDIDGFEREEVTMQYEDVTYQIFAE